MLRGWLALAFACLALAVGDIVERLIVTPLVWIAPSPRTPILAGWIKIMAWLVTRPVGLIGGFRIPRPERIVPSRPDVLILMNHQSLFDIPLVIQAVSGGYPRIVTRKRYAQRIPLISHMIGLYQYPVVDPAANADGLRDALDQLEAAARETQVPLAVFPEGTRTKDGEIGRFKRAGLSRILATRPWTVYVFVADGFWRAAKIKDFARGVKRVQGRMEHVATLEWTDPEADPRQFIAGIRETMVERLEAMRGGAAVP